MDRDRHRRWRKTAFELDISNRRVYDARSAGDELAIELATDDRLDTGTSTFAPV